MMRPRHCTHGGYELGQLDVAKPASVASIIIVIVVIIIIIISSSGGSSRAERRRDGRA